MIENSQGYTVVLLRSKALSSALSGDDNPQPEDMVYVAQVQFARDLRHAVTKAKLEAQESDALDMSDEGDLPYLFDYSVLVVFSGIQDVEAYGFQDYLYGG